MQALINQQFDISLDEYIQDTVAGYHEPEFIDPNEYVESMPIHEEVEYF